MKSMFLLLLFLFSVGLSLSAQQTQPPAVPQNGAHPVKREPINLQKDKQVMEGFVVKLLPAPDGLYSFQVLKDNQPIYLQLKNPFTGQPGGFEKKEDAFNIARWMIKEYKRNGQFPQVIPPHVAQEFNIDIFKQKSTNGNQ